MPKVFQLVTIFCEAILEVNILKDIESLGIKGYTVSDCRGRGTHVTVRMINTVSTNIRIEVMCEQELSLRMAHLLSEKYEKNYGLLIFSRPVEVLN